MTRCHSSVMSKPVGQSGGNVFVTLHPYPLASAEREATNFHRIAILTNLSAKSIVHGALLTYRFSQSSVYHHINLLRSAPFQLLWQLFVLRAVRSVLIGHGLRELACKWEFHLWPIRPNSIHAAWQ